MDNFKDIEAALIKGHFESDAKLLPPEFHRIIRTGNAQRLKNALDIYGGRFDINTIDSEDGSLLGHAAAPILLSKGKEGCEMFKLLLDIGADPFREMMPGKTETTAELVNSYAEILGMSYIPRTFLEMIGGRVANMCEAVRTVKAMIEEKYPVGSALDRADIQSELRAGKIVILGDVASPSFKRPLPPHATGIVLQLAPGKRN